MEKFYFIQDASGNYYRTNDKNLLVVAKSAGTAEKFTYVEAKKRVGTGKKASFYSVVPATEQVEEEVIVASRNFQVTQVDWLDGLRDAEFMMEYVNFHIDQMQHSLSKVDLEICDYMHLVELYDLSDGEKLIVVEDLKRCRQRRRDIKDEIFKAETFQKAMLDDGLLAKVKHGIKQIENLEVRNYSPRVREDIFEGLRELSYEEKHEDLVEDTYVGGVSDMEYVKKTTIFDGENFDFAAFARRQEAFYRDLEQYSINLNIELDEIDEELDATMNEIENANYNVAQGYKVFKHLKDLREQRRYKMEELKKVNVFLDNIDCAELEKVSGFVAEEVEIVVKDKEEEAKITRVS